MTDRYRILCAMWDGGGTVPPELAVVRALVARGHDVRVIADAVLADEVRATGATHLAWTTAPQHHSRAPEDDFIRDWEVGNPMAAFARVRDRFFCGPAALFANDTQAALRAYRADVVVTSQMLFGAQIGAEAAGVPVVMTCANVYSIPGMGQPLFGAGFQPARSALGRVRDRAMGAVMERLFDSGRTTINELRTSLGLTPLTHTMDQMRRQETVLLIDEAFDFPAAFPANVRYAGAQLDDPSWTEPWTPPAGDAPLVLVAMSSSYQAQDRVLRRVTDALGMLGVRGVVTTGPAVDPSTIDAPKHVQVIRSAPHAEVLRHASVVVTHGGHGTVVKALAAGVPLLILPMGRDQPDNAARVTARGAGLRLKHGASSRMIAADVHRLMNDDHFRMAARRMGEHIRATAGPHVAVERIEMRAACSVAAAPTAPPQSPSLRRGAADVAITRSS